MRRVIIAFAIALALVAVFWWHRPAQHSIVNASIYETDMVENLVRGILPEFAASPPPVCFLAFGDGTTPPSHEFIARFAGSRPAMRSCDSAASPPIGKYFEISTGKPGLILHIISFKEFTPGCFDVQVGFSNLPPGHERFAYRISKIAGEWKIESRKPA